MNYVVLYEPEKPSNVGNIIRTCSAFNARLIIIGNLTFELSDKSLKRAGMDYFIGFRIKRYETFDDFFTYEKGDYFYVTRYSEKTYSEFDLSDVRKTNYFLFGKESSGLPKELLKSNYESCMRIPMAIDARSLNLSNSVAIVLSEALRQQDFFSLAKHETIKGEDFLKNS